VFGERYTDIAVYEKGSFDFGAGRSGGHAPAGVGSSTGQPEVRYISDQAVYVEGLVKGRWVGRYWSADGRINVPHEVWADDAFQLAINNEPLTSGWRWISGTELPRSDRSARHYVIELSNAIRPITVRVHTLVDGTPVLTRWLEILNRSEKPVALTAVCPWSGRLIMRRSESPGEATLGYFTRQDWSYEGWFRWQRLEPGIKAITCDQARSHDDPFFVVRNEASGEYFIGHLAWTTQWRMEFERNDSGVLFRVGPWAEKAALRVIAPGETVTAPAVHLGHVSGSLDRAVQAMHDHLRRSVLPARPAERSYRIQYLVPADQGYYIPFDEASALKCVDVAAAIGAEVFVLDYGWWDVNLDWVPSASRFPRGLKPLADYVRGKGMLFGLYVRSEGDAADVPQSRIAKKHPDWIGPSNTVQLQLPDAAKWVESEVCRLVEEHGLDLYRLDYNPSFKFGATSRDGFMENNCWRYYEAFYGTYERIHRKYPNLILQQAAGGGGRNDLGTCARFHEPYLTDGLWIPRELQVYSGLTLGLPPENFVILHLAHGGGVGFGLPQPLDTILRMSYGTSTPQIFCGIVAPNIETLAPERRERFLHYGRIYKQSIRPLLPSCRVYHHEPVNSRGGVDSGGWFVMEYAASDRSKGWAVLVRIGPTDSDTYVFRPRGLDLGGTYRVTFDGSDTAATLDGVRLSGEGLPIRLENVGLSELLLFERQGLNRRPDSSSMP
jgi:alpha-galactosidase